METQMFEVRDTKATYRSGRDNLGEDFFGPFLHHCVEYKRAAGYFSSSAFVYWAAGLPRIVADSEVKLRLIVSPELTPDDLTVLKEVASSVSTNVSTQDVIDRYIERAIAFSESTNNSDLRLDIFGWLVKSGRLELRLAIVNSGHGNGIYHEKFGVFRLPGGERVAFIGSANESRQAYERNGELVVVFRSWVSEDTHRIDELDNEFDEAWEGKIPGLRIFSPSKKILERLKGLARKPSTSVDQPASTNELQDRPPPWPHQQQAIDTFLQKKRGVLEMATGTGKTRTALEIAILLAEADAIDSIVVATEGNDLLRQWYGELLQLRSHGKKWRRVYRHFGGTNNRENFILDPTNSCLVISRDALGPLLRGLRKNQRSRTLVIHDEVHGLGAPSKVKGLIGLHRDYQYVLGLSATPEREYDEEGTSFIEKELGPVIFKFELPDAIRAAILCPFDYVPLQYSLTDDDRKRLKNVWGMKAARRAEGRPMSDAEVAIELSKVYKTAEMKPDVFAQYLETNADCLKNTIIFVETREYGEKILPVIQKYTLKYKTYYADDESTHLSKFAQGGLDCLITCHKLSQGIDIPHLQTVVLFSSARARLETIQRIGRCLRRDKNDPNKRASVIDFILYEDEAEKSTRVSADSSRGQWLSEIAKIEPENTDGD